MYLLEPKVVIVTALTVVCSVGDLYCDAARSSQRCAGDLCADSCTKARPKGQDLL